MTEQKFTRNARVVLEKRYLRKDSDGTPAESPEDMFWRVANDIASADSAYEAQRENVDKTALEFYDAMVNLEFLPNSPTLRGAGRRLQQLSGCYVVPVEDSLEGIFDALKAGVQIQKSGGGVGYSFSRLRPSGDTVASTGNIAGGPVSFMRVFDSATKEVTQGGVRMGANMGVLRVDHPDIMEFIECKSDGGLQSFNISVAVTDEFMEAAESGDTYDLVNPRNSKVVGQLNASDVLRKIAEHAWATGDPGVLFIDRINRDNHLKFIADIEATNPCGEQPLLPWESCNLGSINLTKFIKGDGVDWVGLQRIVRLAVHFLDNVIDRNKYPLDVIKSSVRASRKIGLGVMGFAEALIMLGIPYNSDEAAKLGYVIMRFINQEAISESEKLANIRDYYGAYYSEKCPDELRSRLRQRNLCVTSIAPTGTLSVIAGTSGGIEPLFALAYNREALFNKDGSTETLAVVNSLFEKVAKERGFYSDELMDEIANSGSIQDVDDIPDDVKRVFVTSHDIEYEWHVRMQAAFQENVDSAVSKTVNFPNSASVDDVLGAYKLAFAEGCKGITVYRDGSLDAQVLHTTKSHEKQSQGDECKKKPRPAVLSGETRKVNTPIGTAFVTINENGGSEPFEVFIHSAKAGSETAAVSEAMGRLISYILRLSSSVSSRERMAEVCKQLSGIGGSRPHGFGPNRVLSLPDGVASALLDYMSSEGLDAATHGDLCPECGNASLMNQEGCRKCNLCGHSEC